MKNHFIKVTILIFLLFTTENIFGQRVTLTDSLYLKNIRLYKDSYSKEQLLKICIKDYAKTRSFIENYVPKAERKSEFYYIFIDTVDNRIYIDIIIPMPFLRRYERLYPEEKRVFPNKFIQYRNRLFVYKEGSSEPSKTMLDLLDNSTNYAHSKYDEQYLLLCEYAEDRRFIVDMSNRVIEVYHTRITWNSEPWGDGTFRVRPEDRDTLSFQVAKITNVDKSLLNSFDSITSAMDSMLLEHYQYGLVSIEDSDSSCQMAKIRLANICDFQKTDTFIGYVKGKKLLFLFRNMYDNIECLVDSSECMEIRYFNIDLEELPFFEDSDEWPCKFDWNTEHVNLIFHRLDNGWHFSNILYGPLRNMEFWTREIVGYDL